MKHYGDNFYNLNEQEIHNEYEWSDKNCMHAIKAIL